MTNHVSIENTPVGSAAMINSIISDFEEEIRFGDANYESTKPVKAIKAQTITFYFGDQVIGEVKFTKSGTKAEKIERCKKTLIKELQEKNKLGIVGQMLYSPFCNFKIR